MRQGRLRTTLIAGVAAVSLSGLGAASAQACPNGRACTYTETWYNGWVTEWEGDLWDGAGWIHAGWEYSLKNRYDNRRFQVKFNDEGLTCVNPGGERPSRLFNYVNVGSRGSRC